MDTVPPRCPSPWCGDRGHAVAGLGLDMALIEVHPLPLQLLLAADRIGIHYYTYTTLTQIHTCINTYTHMHTHIHTHAYTHTHTHAYIHTHTCIHTYTYTCIPYTHTHTCIHTYTHMHTHIHTHAYTHTHMNIHTYTHMQGKQVSELVTCVDCRLCSTSYTCKQGTAGRSAGSAAPVAPANRALLAGVQALQHQLHPQTGHCWQECRLCSTSCTRKQGTAGRSAGSAAPVVPANRALLAGVQALQHQLYPQTGHCWQECRLCSTSCTCKQGTAGRSAGSAAPVAPANRALLAGVQALQHQLYLQTGHCWQECRLCSTSCTCKQGTAGRSAGSAAPVVPANRALLAGVQALQHQLHLQTGHCWQECRLCSTSCTCKQGTAGRSAGSAAPVAPANRALLAGVQALQHQLHLQTGHCWQECRLCSTSCTCKQGTAGRSAGSAAPVAPQTGHCWQECRLCSTSCQCTHWMSLDSKGLGSLQGEDGHGQ